MGWGDVGWVGEVGRTNLYIPLSAHSRRRVGGTQALEEDWRDIHRMGGARGGWWGESHVRREARQCRTWRRNLQWSRTSCCPSSPQEPFHQCLLVLFLPFQARAFVRISQSSPHHFTNPPSSFISTLRSWLQANLSQWVKVFAFLRQMIVLKQPPCIYLSLGVPPWGCSLGVGLSQDNWPRWPPSIPDLIPFEPNLSSLQLIQFSLIYDRLNCGGLSMAYILKKKKSWYHPKHCGGIQASNSSTHHQQIHQCVFSPSETIHTALSLNFLTVVILIAEDFFEEQNDKNNNSNSNSSDRQAAEK